jgi:hypothetical protein
VRGLLDRYCGLTMVSRCSDGWAKTMRRHLEKNRPRRMSDLVGEMTMCSTVKSNLDQHKLGIYPFPNRHASRSFTRDELIWAVRLLFIYIRFNGHDCPLARPRRFGRSRGTKSFCYSSLHSNLQDHHMFGTPQTTKPVHKELPTLVLVVLCLATEQNKSRTPLPCR